MKFLVAIALFWAAVANALHFYVETGETKCFYEELAKDTLIVGKFNAEELDPKTNIYIPVQNLQVEITVDETFDNNHRVVNQKNSPNGQFTFTSLDAGEHKFCITPRHTDWTKRAKHRVEFDLARGDAKSYVDSKRKQDVSSLTTKTNELIRKLQEIRREQSLFREREAIFRDVSESTNSRVMNWTFFQIIVLVGTCTWQLTYLKNFFVKQKVV